MASDRAETKGGGFLLNPCGGSKTISPELMSGAQRELSQAVARFSAERVMPFSEGIEACEAGLVHSLMREAGELGFFSAEVPEEDGGMGLGAVEAAAIAENISHQGSFVVSFLCHCGIGMYPLLAFGKDEQKRKYLPAMISGESVGAFALTEAEAGSDALAVRTRAVLTPGRRHYLLTGEKLYCTNAAQAGIFTVFAKTEVGFTAFLVERATPGLTIGAEEQKMGIHGSSTASVILSGAEVPVENILGDEGRGHRVAFATLNVGRMKLGAACMGTARRLVADMAVQANTRRQFGRPIGSFELVKQKVARSAARAFLAESLVYRLAGDFDSCPGAADELSIEAAVSKVYCSEAIASVADEAVALFGGCGYIRGFAPERIYRDCRIDRIFEGTNEICRLFIAATLIKRALSGRLPLMERLGEILAGLKGGFPKADPSLPFASTVDGIEELKRTAIYLAGVALKKFGEGIRERQSVLAAIADIAIESYAFDSAVSRAVSLFLSGEREKAQRQGDLCAALLAERMPALVSVARQALINVAAGEETEYAPYLKALLRIASPHAFDTDAAWARIASHVLEKEACDL
ncbi:MAG TPA: acyl-CoA dehydrogenase family protein [bacterium]|nr:acyl-CoA dehydrogenase family protein [bacterium]